MYNQSKSHKTILLNLQYSVVFCNGRDALEFCIMAFQICLNDNKWLVNASYEHYGYLILYHHLETYENQIIVTNIL